MKYTIKNRLVNFFEYREKKKEKIKDIMKIVPKGIHQGLLNKNLRHPLVINKRLIILPFEKKMLIWTWVKIKEFCQFEMLDIGVEIFFKLLTEHEEFKPYIEINIARLDTIRKVSDAFIAMMDMIMENFYDDIKVDRLLDVLTYIHMPLNIPWNNFKQRLEKDWETDFDEMWDIFLLQLWIGIASGTLANPISQEQANKYKDIEFISKLDNYFKTKKDQLKILDEFYSTQDIECIRKSFETLSSILEQTGVSFGQYLVVQMNKSENFAKYFAEDKNSQERNDDIINKINTFLIKYVENLERKEDLNKIWDEVRQIGQTVKIEPVDCEIIENIFIDLLEQKISDISQEIKDSWKRFILMVYYNFSYDHSS
ncbi:hypothetical protein HZS_6687 [Henneguya salminicola]|nr:hypothetical protein HZS_6687 [Henneguya salminicola]